MKKFVQYIVYFLLFFVALDLINRPILTYQFSHLRTNSIAYSRYIYETNEYQSDIFIVGASKSTHNYIPQMIEDSLHVTCFNGGQDGQNINYQYLSIKKAFQNGPVKYVILDLARPQIGSTEWRDRVDYHKIFYWKNPEAAEYVNRIKGKKIPYLMCSSSYQFNSRIVDIIGQLFTGNYGIKGYVPLPYTGDTLNYQPTTHEESQKFSADETLLMYLDKCVALCKSNNTKLVLCYSPSLSIDNEFSKFLSCYAQDNEVYFWDYSNCESIVSDLTLFKDALHLNDNGAKLFTNLIINELKSIQE